MAKRRTGRDDSALKLREALERIAELLAPQSVDRMDMARRLGAIEAVVELALARPIREASNPYQP